MYAPPKKSNKLKKLIIFTALVAVSWWGYQAMFSAGDAPAQPGGMMPGGAPPVQAAKALLRNVQVWDEFSGIVVAVERVEIRPRVSGNIDKVHFKEGDLVKKGQPLFTIDPRPYQADLKAAEARAAQEQADLARAQALIKSKAISPREFDTRKNAAADAAAELVRARLNVEYAEIRAPVSGRVSRAEVTVGNLVEGGPSAPVLTRIVSQSPMYVDFTIDEAAYVRYLAAHGMDAKALGEIPVTMSLSGEETQREGKIISFDNQLSPGTGSIRVRAAFDNENGALVPGLYARVMLGGTTVENAVLVHERAILTDQNRKLAMVIGADGTSVEPRPVRLGPAAGGGLRVVTDGVKADELVIVNGLQRAQPGAKVTPEVVDMETLKAEGAPAPAAPETEGEAPPAPSE